MKKTLIISLAFWLIGLVVGYIAIVGPVDLVQATDSDTASTTVIIGNATPTITVNTITSPVTLTENSTVTAFATSTVADNNGCDDIESVTAVFFDDNAANNDCAADGQNCYPVASTTCTATVGSCTGGSDTEEQYTCSVSVLHYTNGGTAPDWRWYLSAGDGDATGTQTSNEVTIADLLALDVTEPAIDYSTLSLGATSTQATTTAKNTGNHNDLSVGIQESIDFACTLGTISSSQQHYATTSGFSYGDGTALAATSSSPTQLDTAIAQGSDGSTTPSQPIYWLLVVPNGVSGTCNGQNYFEAQNNT